MPATSVSSASSFESRSGAKPPSSPTAVPRPRSCSVFFSAWKTSAPVRRASAKRRRADRHDHELLEVDLVVGVRAAVQHVHHRHGQHVRRLAAEVAPERQPVLRPRSPWPRPATRRGSRWRRGAPLFGVPSSSIIARSSACLVGGVEAPARRRRARRSRWPPPSSRPCRRTASPPSRSSTASNSPVEAPEGTAARPDGARAQHDVDLDGRVAAAVEDLAGVDLLDLAHRLLLPERASRVTAAQGELRIDSSSRATASTTDRQERRTVPIAA